MLLRLLISYNPETASKLLLNFFYSLAPPELLQVQQAFCR